MIEFTRIELDKAIKTSVEYKINIDSKYPITSIDEIANLNEFTYNPTKIDKNFKYVDISSVSNGRIDYSSIVKGPEAPSRARRLAKKDSVLISTVRPNLRAFAYVEDEVKDAIYSTGFAILSSKDMTLLPKYLYYMFMDYEFTMKQITAMMPKGMYPSINATNIRSIRIPLPPMDIQKKIADECKKVDEDVATANKELDNCNNAINTIILPCFDKYQKIILESICDSFEYGTSEKSTTLGIVPVLRMGNIVDGTIDWNDLVYTSNEQDIKKLSLKKGDVLFNRTNSPIHVGKTALYEDEKAAIFAGYMVILFKASL